MATMSTTSATIGPAINITSGNFDLRRRTSVTDAGPAPLVKSYGSAKSEWAAADTAGAGATSAASVPTLLIGGLLLLIGP